VNARCRRGIRLYDFVCKWKSIEKKIGTRMPAVVDEALNFLSEYRPKILAELKAEYSDRPDVFVANLQGDDQPVPGRPAAPTDYELHPSTRIRGRVALAALKEIASASIEAVAVASAQLRRAERFEDFAAGATALAAMCTAFAAFASVQAEMRIAAGVLTLASAVWGVVARARKRATFAKDIGEHAKSLADSAGRAAHASRELEAMLSIQKSSASHEAAVEVCIGKAEELLRKVNTALLDLNMRPVSA
jgi:hypothetical protein